MTGSIQVGDRVVDCRGRSFRVVKLVSIFGIPSADLVLLRRGGQEDHRSFKDHNLPLSCLEKAPQNS